MPRRVVTIKKNDGSKVSMKAPPPKAGPPAVPYSVREILLRATSPGRPTVSASSVEAEATHDAPQQSSQRAVEVASATSTTGTAKGPFLKKTTTSTSLKDETSTTSAKEPPSDPGRTTKLDSGRWIPGGTLRSREVEGPGRWIPGGGFRDVDTGRWIPGGGRTLRSREVDFGECMRWISENA